MKIGIVLPMASFEPIGGYKVIYEYANRLIQDKNDVYIFYQDSNALSTSKAPELIKKIYLDIKDKIEPRWFALNKKIKRISLRGNDNIISDLDIVIATAGSTALFVKKKFRKAKLVYFIQGFDKWELPPKKLYETYNSGLINVTVSTWLKEVVEQHSDKPVYLVPNALDTNIYRVINPIVSRNPYVIGMLYHDNPVKGTKYTLSAIKKLHKKYSNIKLIMFGTPKAPENLPNWITYIRNASQAETVSIYNKISIFACGTVEEGFGLTGLEAMACGAALVSTDYEAVNEYAINNKNSLLSPVKNVDALEKNIETLVLNDKKRIDIATNGTYSVNKYSIENSYEEFKRIIMAKVSNE